MSKLQELICTKINHDIIGNVGAVCNAVELLEEDDLEFICDIKNILKTSSFVLSSRLKFFRIVFGSSNVSLENLSEIVQNYVDTIAGRNYPVKTNLKNINQQYIKMILLMVMIVADLMIKGGEIVLDNLSVSATSLQNNQEKLATLISGNVPQTPANAPLLYLQELLGEENKTLNIKQNNDNIFLEVA